MGTVVATVESQVFRRCKARSRCRAREAALARADAVARQVSGR